ncbi:MAG: hypothetical protein Tsb009_02300 [Planctomycetaceae bacterium]
MATDIADDPELDLEDLQEGQEQAPSKAGFSLSARKVKILVLLVLVMAVESAGFYLLVPETGGSTTKEEVDPMDPSVDVETIEIEIEKIVGLVNQIAEPGVSTDVSFNLIVLVAADQEVQFNEAWKSRRADVRQNVEKIILGASSEELRDPAREVIIRRIRESINKTLRKSYVRRVILTHWSVSSR